MKNWGLVLLIFCIGLVLSSCSKNNSDPTYISGRLVTVLPSYETTPVLNAGDYADDAVVWIHPNNTDSSFLVGLDKSSNGRIEYFNADGNRYGATNLTKSFNNLSITYGYSVLGKSEDLVVASNRTDNKLQFFKVDSESRSLIDLSGDCLIGYEPYGIALYQNKNNDSLYCFVSQRNTPFNVLQYVVRENEGLLDVTLVRTIETASLTEGIFVDEKLGYVYVAEEDVGLYKYNANPSGGQNRLTIDYVGSPNIAGSDIEGITLYCLSDFTGYLIVSIQYNNTFNVYSREGDEFIGSFTIGSNGSIDKTEQTDGIFVSSSAFSSIFSNGVFIAHDGSANGYTNYKLVSWKSIADSLGLQLNPSFDPR
jgi:3-phytase